MHGLNLIIPLLVQWFVTYFPVFTIIFTAKHQQFDLCSSYLSIRHQISPVTIFSCLFLFFIAVISYVTPPFLLPGDAVKTNKNTQMWFFFFLIHVWRVCSSCWHPPLPPPPPQRTLLPLRTDHARLFHPQEEIKLINWLILAPKCVFLVNWWIIQCFHLGN